ncbi:MAG: hypothetical protein Q9187_003201 [Circinaria calcarea]
MTALPLYVSQWITLAASASPRSRHPNHKSPFGKGDQMLPSPVDTIESKARSYDLVKALDEAISSGVGEKWPKPSRHFPGGSPYIVWYYSPSPCAWNPRSEPHEWSWPAWISRAFLDGNLGWIEASNGRPARVKINIERDDLLEYFASDEKRATTAADARHASKVLTIRIDKPTDCDDKPEAKEANKCEVSITVKLPQNTQDKAVPRLTPDFFKVLMDERGDTETKSNVELEGEEAPRISPTVYANRITISEDREDDNWLILDEDDYAESWDRVSRRPTRCGGDIWQRLPQREQRNEMHH